MVSRCKATTASGSPCSATPVRADGFCWWHAPALEAERVPCAPVLTLHEAMAHPHLRERGTVRRVCDATIGEFDIPGLPAKFSRWATHSDVAADRLGEHNDAVLREFLSLTDADIAGLYADSTIVRDPTLEAQ